MSVPLIIGIAGFVVSMITGSVITVKNIALTSAEKES
jgi:hypothetical protein